MSFKLFKYLKLLFFVIVISLNAQTTKSECFVQGKISGPDSLDKRGIVLKTGSVADTGKNAIDTTSVKQDTTKKKAPADTLKPIYNSYLDSKSNVLTANEYNRRDYRTAIDLFSYFPHSFIRSTGTVGQPEQLVLNGAGGGKVAVLEDGIPVNEPIYNFYDFNRAQEEGYSALEVVNSNRSFIYDINNSGGVVSFINKDFVSKAPYSRIKYYEGQLGEGYLDVQYASMIGKKFSLFTEMTNTKMDVTYANNDYSTWKFKLNGKYFVNNNLNLLVGYNYTKSIVGLNGGVDYDSIKSLPSITDLDQTLYDRRLAPVNYLHRYQKEGYHSLYFKVYSRYFDFGETYATLNYRSGLNEFRVDEDVTLHSKERLISDRSYDSWLGNLKQKVSFSQLSLTLLGNYEYLTHTRNSFVAKDYVNFSVAGLLDFRLPFIDADLAGFVKQAKVFNTYLTGSGLDLAYNKGHFTFYAGGAVFESYDNVIEQKETIKNFEGSVAYKDSLINGALSLIYKKGSGVGEAEYKALNIINGDGTSPSLQIASTDYIGVGLQFNIKVSKFLFESTTQFNQSLVYNTDENALPKLSTKYGLYYTDVLFDSSLSLKTGLNISYNTSSAYSFYDYYNRRVYYDVTKEKVAENYKLDFYLSGKVQDAVVIFFVWENILNNSYYITPYYPMPQRGMRFGVMWEFIN